jgi:hypothetical protein
MAITISTTGEFRSDQTSGLQNGGTLDKDDFALTAATLAQLPSAFSGFLNGLTTAIPSSLRANAADYGFGFENGTPVAGTPTSPFFINVATDAGETVSKLYFSNNSGDLFTGEVAKYNGSDIHVAGGSDQIHLYSFAGGDILIGSTEAPADVDVTDPSTLDGSKLVFAYFLQENATHTGANVWGVNFQPLDHPIAGSDAASLDDAIDFGDFLNVTAEGTLSFTFDTLESGKFLWVAVGNEDAGLLATGKDLNVDPANANPASKAGQMVTGGQDPSDAMNTSQGGTGATIGVNSQMFVAGNTAVLTLTTGFTSLDGGPDATGDHVQDIDYGGYIDTDGAAVFISQTQGQGPVNLTIKSFHAGGANDTPETSFAYIGAEGGNNGTSGAFEDDGQVGVNTVEVFNGTTKVGTWVDGAASDGTTIGGVKITINGNTITATGLRSQYTLHWTSDAGETFNRFQVTADANTTAFDVGRIDVDRGVKQTQNVGEDLFIHDDGPVIDIARTTATLAFGLDESIVSPRSTSDESGSIAAGDDDTLLTAPDGTNAFGAHTTATGDVAALFTDTTASAGTDGGSRTDGYTLSLTTAGGTAVTAAAQFDSGAAGFNGVQSTFSTSADVASGGDARMFLFRTSSTVIEGRADLDGDGVYDDVVLKVTLLDGTTSDPKVKVDQILAIDHGTTTDHDESATLGIAGSPVAAAGVAVVKTSSYTDGDGDTASDSASYNMTDDIVIEDDGPLIDITLAANPTLDLGMDESIASPTSTSDESGSIAADVDDTLLTAPNGTGAFGSRTTAAGDVAALFADTTVDAGTDGDSRSDAYTLSLTDGAGNPITAAAQFNSGQAGFNGVESTLTTSEGTATNGDDTIYLFRISSTAIEGRVDLDGDGIYDDVALKITMLDGTTTTPKVKVEQILAMEHGTTTDHDEAVTLGVAGATDAAAGVGVVKTSTLTDNDGDTASDSQTYNMTSNVVIEDDGPQITAQIADGVVDFAVGASTGAISLHGDVGTDENDANNLAKDGTTKTYTIDSWTTPTNVIAGLVSERTADKTTVNYFVDGSGGTTGKYDAGIDSLYYDLTLNQTANSGAGSYTFTAHQNAPAQFVEFDFTDLPSNQSLFGLIAADKGNLDGSDALGLAIIAQNAKINDPGDGQYTNASLTINTSKGGGAVTIGVSNQMFDPTDGAFFVYITDPDNDAVAGVGSGLSTAYDDADNLGFNGTKEVTTASFEIVQNDTSAKSRITAYDITAPKPGRVGDPATDGQTETIDTTSRDFVKNPTANSTTVNVTAVRVYDSAHNLLEAVANNSGTATLVDGDGDGTVDSDSTVSVAFVQVGGKYSADVSINKHNSGYTVEFDTDVAHDMALITGQAGKFDIGGFNFREGQDTPDQNFDFSVKITDADLDTAGGQSDALANFSVEVDGTGQFANSQPIAPLTTMTTMALATTSTSSGSTGGGGLSGGLGDPRFESLMHGDGWWM